MVMIVQLILLLRVSACVDVVVSVIGLLAGEDSSTTVDDVTTRGGDHKKLLLYPHRHHLNNRLRTISII